MNMNEKVHLTRNLILNKCVEISLSVRGIQSFSMGNLRLIFHSCSANTSIQDIVNFNSHNIPVASDFITKP